jgi:cation-transporting ATPase E
LTIGIPTFFLALAPNLRRYIPGFVDRVLRFAIPAGFIVAVSVFTAYWLARSNGLSLVEQRTSASLVALMLSLSVLVIVALPITWRRALLVGSVTAGFVLLFPLESVRKFYALELPTKDLGLTLLIGFAGIALMITAWIFSQRLGWSPSAAIRPAEGGSLRESQ